MDHTYTLLVTDRNLVVLGDPIGHWEHIEVVSRFNAVGSGIVRTPATAAIRQLIKRGRRFVLIRDGEVYSSGRIERFRILWSLDGTRGDPGIAEIHWADDLATIASRISYPNPALDATSQDTARRSFTSTNAETIMRTLVNENAGSAALTPRQVPKLALGDVAGVGSDITWSTRFEPLTDAMRDVATVGGRLGFRARQVGTQIVFEVYEPQDLSLQVRFSAAWGSLREYTYDLAAPEVNAAIVGGQDAGADRTVRERVDQLAVDDWWRDERFVDRRDLGDTDELDNAGDDELVRGEEELELSTVTVDTPQTQFGRDYQLGDIVSVAIDQDQEVTDVVRSVQLQVSPDSGELITAMAGSESASADPEWVRQSRQLSRQLSRSSAAGEVPQT